MQRSPVASARRLGAVRILSLLALSGCAIETPMAPPHETPSFAAGGGSGPTVRAADPDSGLRATTIDVRVLGSGFDNGSKAVWAVAGDTAFATTKVKTNSTRFVKSGELVANITIAADAPLALFDIVVVTLAGKKGIGIEKFTVKETGNPPDRYSALFDESAGQRVRSDDGTAYADGGPNYSPNCVLSTGSGAGGGVYQLRTIAPTDPCKAVTKPGWRYFKLDFGAPVADLDQDGVAEAIEDVPGRMLVGVLGSGATSTPVKILIFVVDPDGSTTWDTKWSLLYRANVAEVAGGGSQILQASAGNAAVDIYAGYVDTPVKKNVKPVATMQLPFKLTVTPMP
jgi:hypothetical protein